MNTFEWFLLVIVVIGVPLIIAVVVTLWTLEQARQRKRSNRPGAAASIGVKRKATRDPDAAPAAPGTDATGVGTNAGSGVAVPEASSDPPETAATAGGSSDSDASR